MALGPTAYSRFAAHYKPVQKPKPSPTGFNRIRAALGASAPHPVKPMPLPGRSAPAPHPTPVAPAPVAGVSTSVPPDPRDAQYFTDIAGIDAYYNSHIAQDTGELNRTETLTNQALSRLLQRKPEDIQDAVNAYNSRGLFYSGALSKKKGDIEVNYAQRQQDINQARDFQKAQLQADIANTSALYGPSGINRASAYNAAVDRQLGRDAQQGVPFQAQQIPSIEQLASKLATLIPARAGQGNAPGGSAPATAKSKRPKAPAFNPKSKVFNAMTRVRFH